MFIYLLLDAGESPMSKKNETRLKGPWKNLQAAIWLIGLAILALYDWWWPGILVLVAVSMLSQGLIQYLVPSAVEVSKGSEETRPVLDTPVTSNTNPSPSQPAYPTDRLPSECPKCTAPIRGMEVRWTGPQSADCPYCGANLPLRQA
jgi:hypothetical protein